MNVKVNQKHKKNDNVKSDLLANEHHAIFINVYHISLIRLRLNL